MADLTSPFAIVALEGTTATVIPDTAFTERQRAAIAHIVLNRGVDALTPAPNAAARAPSPTDRVSLTGAARAQGYTGECCQNATCGGFRVKRNGSCTVCDDCGQTTGCS